MQSNDVKVAKVEAKSADLKAKLDFLRSVGFGAREAAAFLISNPALAGVSALALNQLVYKLGVYDPRAFTDKDGKKHYYDTKYVWDLNILNGGWKLGEPTTVEISQGDVERIASQNATAIGVMILAATVAYAAGPKMPTTALINPGGVK